MPFALSMLYLLTQSLTPTTIFGPAAHLHIEMYLAILIALISLPAAIRSNIVKSPQSLALVGLSACVCFSLLINLRWLGGTVSLLLEFIPFIFAYVLIYLHFNSRARLQLLTAMLVFVCLFVIGRGLADLGSGVSADEGRYTLQDGSFNRIQWDADHPYLIAMKNEQGNWIYRLRGQGEIQDPNDFGQVALCTATLLMLFWRPGKVLRNLAFVFLPGALLFAGIYLTHSRGALLGIGAVLLVAARRRIGLIPGLALAGGFVAIALTGHFTGGRSISLQSGSDRTALWGDGLQMVKSSPLFGVGYEQFKEHASNTAHNSVAVCAAELGIVGLYFWCLFLLPTMRDAFVIASSAKVVDGRAPPTGAHSFRAKQLASETLNKMEVNQIGRALILSLTAYLVTGWFLSRAFATPLFLLGGMVEVVYGNALKQGTVPPRMPLPRVLLYALYLAIGLVVLMYLMLRVLNLFH